MKKLRERKKAIIIRKKKIGWYKSRKSDEVKRKH